MKQLLSLFLLLLFLSACSSIKPPTEFAPDGETISQALILQIKQTQNRLSQELKLPEPEFSISQINIKTIEPIYIANLAAYHLSGTYTFKLKQSHKSISQKDNLFDLFLQRQAEGKTWRLLVKNLANNGTENQWSSYLIQSLENLK